MARDNNNSGLHFIRHNKAKYDDIKYYDENSMQGTINRRYEAIAELESLGEYLFAQKVAFVYVRTGEAEYCYHKCFSLSVYDRKYLETLKPISTPLRMYNPKKADDRGIKVRKHDKYNILYITKEHYDEMKHRIDENIRYDLR